jgi:hypothetical protein
MLARALPCLVLALALAVPAPSVAAGVALDRYRGAPTAEDGFALSRPGDFDDALDPLVYETHQGRSSTEDGPVVENHLVGRLTGALGLLDRLVLFLGLPVNLMMSGRDYPNMPGPDGTGLGDAFVGARVRIWGEPGELFALGLQAVLTAPTAEAANRRQSFAGDWTLGGEALLLLELRWRWVIATLDVGARFRRPADLGSLDVGQELVWAFGLTVPALPGTLEAYLETWGTTMFASFGDRETTPLELLAGLRVWAADGLALGVAGGSGLGTRGYGAPDVRGVLTFGWAVPAGDPD